MVLQDLRPQANRFYEGFLMTDSPAAKSKMKTVLMKGLTAASFISLGWMGPGLVEQFSGPASVADAPSATTPLQFGVTPAATMESAAGQGVAGTLPDGETNGLLLLGATFGPNLANLQDPRDLCRVVKSNTALTNPPAAEKRYTSEFESCAGRVLHYDASLLQMGALIGQTQLAASGPGDYCAIKKVASLRADMKIALQGGKAIATHDETLVSLNNIFKSCEPAGEFKIDNQTWNNAANQMILLPFYQQKPAAP